jgi:hypothetical protein
MRKRIRIPLALLLCAVFDSHARAGNTAPDGAEFFEKKIRPILADNCFKCHSTAQKKKGGLLLDSRATALKGGDTGPAVVPGDPAASLLIKAIRSDDPDVKMPRGGKLSEEQIADLTLWITMGATWPDAKAVKLVATKTFDLKERSRHWSLQPVQRPPLPKVGNAVWCLSPIDRFILAKLEGNGLKPAPSADRRALLRRVTFDLIGLPPTPEETEAFLNDDSPQAFAKVVDRLLASPHYGERWGRHWLDLVRFAETQGHEFDFELPEAYIYRDYVIRAFNADVPFDQFVLEHVAGDLLTSPRRHSTERFNESVIGTGFWHFGEAKHSPVDVRGDQADHLDNQIDVFSKTFLAMTVACARCHDHKFDAISTKDYYALSGYLQSARYQRAFIDEPEPIRKKIARLKDIQSQIKRLVGFDETGSERSPRQAETGERKAGHTIFADFRTESYQNWFVSGEAFGDGPSQPGSVRLQPNPKQPVRTLVSPGIAHSGLVSDKLQGVLRSQTFVIDRKKIHYRVLGHRGQINLIIDGYQLIRDPIYGGLTLRVDHGDKLQWRTMDVSMWLGHRAYVEIVDDGPGYIGVEQIVFSDDGPPWATEVGGRPGPEVKGEDVAGIQPLLAEYQRIEDSLTPGRRAMAMESGTPVDERVFIRGNHKNLGDVVPRRFLEVFGLGGSTAKPENGRSEPARLALAKQLVSPANPLTGRVLVNRLWQHHFGEGIVRTPDDFGLLGQTPSHPELLDWLADEFVRQEWSLKKMHRLMLLSSTYQMASRADLRADELDPDNKLLHKMPIRRLEAECIRDAMLAVSGRLDKKMFGPGGMPFLTPFMAGRGRPATSGPLDGDGRRSIYLNVRRNFLTPMLLAFDYPTPFTTIGRRGVSNVPAQALTLLNNPFVLQQADVLGKRTASDRGLSAKARIGRMYEAAYARPPSDEELAEALAFVEEQARANGNIDDERVWADFAHVLFNLKEFIFLQ